MLVIATQNYNDITSISLCSKFITKNGPASKILVTATISEHKIGFKIYTFKPKGVNRKYITKTYLFSKKPRKRIYIIEKQSTRTNGVLRPLRIVHHKSSDIATIASTIASAMANRIRCKNNRVIKDQLPGLFNKVYDTIIGKGWTLINHGTLQPTSLKYMMEYYMSIILATYLHAIGIKTNPQDYESLTYLISAPHIPISKPNNTDPFASLQF